LYLHRVAGKAELEKLGLNVSQRHVYLEGFKGFKGNERVKYGSKSGDKLEFAPDLPVRRFLRVIDPVF